MSKGYGTSQKHGYPPHYFRWRQMRSRCGNPNNVEFKRYGARGIKVCEDWQNFLVFQKWCFETQELGKTVDRIDNDGPYSPENCRWATAAEQQVTARKTQARRDGIAIAHRAHIAGMHAKYGNPKTRKRKLCGPCGKVLLNAHFSKNRATSDGLQKMCRECQKRYVR